MRQYLAAYNIEAATETHRGLTMLHIHNGDSTAGTLREFGFPGEHKAFQEVLMEGPTPGGLSADEWLETRARFLADDYEVNIEDCARNLREQEAWLSKFSGHDETILWFEHDLFCQVNLIYLLDWLSKQSSGNTRLSLVCVSGFPGVQDFRGLGQLTGEQLASLFDQRHEVTDSELKLAARAWASYCSADPREIQRLIEDDTSVMPFLGRALRLHLARFPSVKNGLGRVENTALEMIATGAIGFKQLFPKFGTAQSGYGLGDSQFWAALKRLGEARDPLIRITGPTSVVKASRSNRYYDASFELTGIGQAVLTGERDFIHLNGIDLWLGGVHLVDGAVWRWDERSGFTPP
ncbi:MAG TPA: RNA polymerase subunit sigma-24 [Blastocatellia bacterium]|nr:RNA polymerase subunit sigma-24 [Blastocatellia bacterium]